MHLTGKECGTSCEQTLIPLDSVMLCSKIGCNCPCASAEEDENGKNLQANGQMNDEQKAIRKAHLESRNTI